MKINIEGTPEEIAKMLQAIASSKEQGIENVSKTMSELTNRQFRGLR